SCRGEWAALRKRAWSDDGEMGRNRSDLIVFAGRRLVQLVPVLLGVVIITFFFTHVAVPDPCAIWAGAHAQPYQIQNCRSTFGLDKPLPDQFVAYLHVFGRSRGRHRDRSGPRTSLDRYVLQQSNVRPTSPLFGSRCPPRRQPGSDAGGDPASHPSGLRPRLPEPGNRDEDDAGL